MEGLGLDVKLILAQIVNFALLLWLLKKYLYRPIIDVLEKRRAKIEADLQKSGEIEKRLEEVEKERDQQRQTNREEAQELLKKSRDQAEAMKVKILTGAREQAETEVKKATEQIKAREEQILKDLRRQIAGLVVAATGKLIQAELDETKQHRLVEKILIDLEKQKQQ